MVDKLGPYDLNQIYTGDTRELALSIPDSSVDLIFTDPIYDRIDDYQWLAETAARVLKPGKSVLAQVGNYQRYEAETAMRKSILLPCDLLMEIYPFAFGAIYPFKVWVGCKPYLWFTKGERESIWLQNRLRGNGRQKDSHEWQDSAGFFIQVISQLCNPGDIVADFFTGGGTVPAVAKMLGVNYWACEIDPATAELARRRVEQTQPPLFVMPQPEQMELDLA